MANSSRSGGNSAGPVGFFISKKDVIYVSDSTSTDKTNPGFKEGIRIGNVKDGKVCVFIPWPEGNTIEAVAADDSGNVYAGFTNTMNSRRFVKIAANYRSSTDARIIRY